MAWSKCGVAWTAYAYSILVSWGSRSGLMLPDPLVSLPTLPDISSPLACKFAENSVHSGRESWRMKPRPTSPVLPCLPLQGGCSLNLRAYFLYQLISLQGNRSPYQEVISGMFQGISLYLRCEQPLKSGRTRPFQADRIPAVPGWKAWSWALTCCECCIFQMDKIPLSIYRLISFPPTEQRMQLRLEF